MGSERETRASRRSAGRYLAVTGGAGVAALIVGFVLGMVAYDEKYFPEGGDLAARLRGETPEPSAFWEVASLVGFLLTLAGALAIAAAVAGVAIVVAVRLVRRAAR